MSVVHRRAAPTAAVTGAIASLFLVGAPAHATAPGPLPAAISAVARDGADLSGILTVKLGPTSEVIDPASLVGELNGAKVDLKLEPVSRAPRRTMLVVDTSGSMGEERIRIARSAARSFLEAAPRDVMVGLVSFASTAGVDVAPTRDRAAVARAVDGLQSNGETALYAAVQSAAKALGPSGDRSLVLLSDGGDTVSAQKTRDAGLAAADLRASGIRAQVIAFRTSESDTKALSALATAGGGAVVPAADARGVSAAFTAVARTLEGQVRWRMTPPAGVTGRLPLALRGLAGAQPFSATTTIDVSRLGNSTGPVTDAVADTEVRADPAGFESSGYTWLLPTALGALSLGLFGLALSLALPTFTSRRSQRVAAVEDYLPQKAADKRARPADSPASMVATTLVAYGDRRMADRKSTTRTLALIERADLPLRPGEWWVLRLVALVVAGATAWLLLGGIGVVLGLLVGIVGPPVLLRYLAGRRVKQFDAQLPDALGLVSSSLGAGFSLQQALDAVARDSADPLAKEFSRALAEARIGAEISDSLERVGERMDSENMRWTAMAIKIQREVGGNLAETLRTTGQTIRDRHSLTRHVAALSAEGKLSAYILVALPVGMFLYMLVANPPYVALLWTTTLGLLMLIGAVVLLAIGIFWMSRTVKVEV